MDSYLSNRRIIVSFYIRSDSMADAYLKLLDHLLLCPKGVVFESTNEWYDEFGKRLSDEDIWNVFDTINSMPIE